MENEFAGKKALIIDDEADIIEYLETFLQDIGFTTFSAQDAIAGAEILKREHPDVVTLDVSMPEKSGGKFLRELQEDETTSSIPVIMVTGVMAEYKDFIHKRKHIKPPQGYVQKPIDRDKMVAVLREVLGM